jgi:hypothetical protein
LARLSVAIAKRTIIESLPKQALMFVLFERHFLQVARITLIAPCAEPHARVNSSATSEQQAARDQEVLF